jgi:hypothetical protein
MTFKLSFHVLLKHDFLDLERCPHCGIHKPSLVAEASYVTISSSNYRRTWASYGCRACGKVVTAWAEEFGTPVRDIYPNQIEISDDIPGKANVLLSQARDCIAQPSGSVLLSNSAVDAMLKEKGFVSGKLHARIDEAISANVLTPEMGDWAHEVRLDSNDERHADLHSELSSIEDAERIFEFAISLGEFLFVLPARISRGRQKVKNETD